MGRHHSHINRFGKQTVRSGQSNAELKLERGGFVITIVDYDAGNVRSVANMLGALGIPCRISGNPADIDAADKLILPGVGHFDYGMAKLAERGLVDALNRRVIEDGIPILGICLGAQLMTRGSDEGMRPGLGWIDGETVAFDRARMDRNLKLPHMGWSESWAAATNPLLNPDDQEARYYYVHSYHLACKSQDQVIITTEYGYEFTSGVMKGNILGVQFHPEKSHRFGMELLRRFEKWDSGITAYGTRDP
jgi:glutamine amidotransferase